MGFFKSFFSGKPANPEEEKQKNNQKNFEIFKYDGMRAQRMGRADYAIKCFTEALALQEDFETMGYLAQVYIQSNELDEARKLLERMIRTEPEHTSTLLTLANVCYMQEDYAAMAEAAKKAIAVEEGNAMAHYLLGKADNGQNDGIMCIAHLTKAIVLKDDFTEARLLRAEALTKMQQYKEAMEDIDAILAQDPDDDRQNSIQLPPLTAGSAVMQSSCRISFFLSAAPCSRQNQTKTRANAAHKNPTDFTSTRTPRYRAIRRLEKVREREAASAMSAVAVSAAAVSAPGAARSSRQLISITP